MAHNEVIEMQMAPMTPAIADELVDTNLGVNGETAVDAAGPDRRVIPRVNSPIVRQLAHETQAICLMFIGFATVYAVALLLTHFPQDGTTRNRAVFFTGLILVTVGFIARFLTALRSYRTSESIHKLELMMERLRNLLFILVTLGVILGTSQILSFF